MGTKIKRNKNMNKLTIETWEVRKTSICIKNKRHTKHRTRPCMWAHRHTRVRTVCSAREREEEEEGKKHIKNHEKKRWRKWLQTIQILGERNIISCNGNHIACTASAIAIAQHKTHTHTGCECMHGIVMIVTVKKTNFLRNIHRLRHTNRDEKKTK